MFRYYCTPPRSNYGPISTLRVWVLRGSQVNKLPWKLARSVTLPNIELWANKNALGDVSICSCGPKHRRGGVEWTNYCYKYCSYDVILIIRHGTDASPEYYLKRCACVRGPQWLAEALRRNSLMLLLSSLP